MKKRNKGKERIERVEKWNPPPTFQKWSKLVRFFFFLLFVFFMVDKDEFMKEKMIIR